MQSAVQSGGDQHSKSSRILEGDQLNTGITGPGATIALALIYIR
jgi:hypothetical protein